MSDIRNRFLKQTATRYAFVTIPDVGDVWFRSKTEDERAEFESRDDARDVKTVKRRLIVEFSCEGDGDDTPVFTMEDVKAMGAVDGAYVDVLASAIMKHNGIGEDDLKAIAGER